MPPITKNLLIINVLMFAATYVLGLRGVDMDGLFALHFFLAPNFHFHQFLTYQFMHAGFEHLFFNMFALWMFGRIVESSFGSQRFLIYYLVCGIGAGVVQEIAQYCHFALVGGTDYPLELIANQLNTWRTVGASGAVYGILLAFGMLYPEERMFVFPIPIPIKAKYFVMGYAVIEFLMAFLRAGDNVAHMAHLGGMLFGFLLILHWRNPRWFEQWKSKIRKPRMSVIRGGASKHQDDMDYNARRKAQDEEIDRILDKLKKRGYEGLTEEEKQKLFNASGRK